MLGPAAQDLTTCQARIPKPYQGRMPARQRLYVDTEKRPIALLDSPTCQIKHPALTFHADGYCSPTWWPGQVQLSVLRPAMPMQSRSGSRREAIGSESPCTFGLACTSLAADGATRLLG